MSENQCEKIEDKLRKRMVTDRVEKIIILELFVFDDHET